MSRRDERYAVPWGRRGFYPTATFAPSAYSYGQATEPTVDAAAEAKTASTKTYTETAAPIIGQLTQALWGSTQREDVEVLKSKIATYRKDMKSAPDTASLPLVGYLPNTKGWYRNQISKLEAQLRAAEELAAEERQTAQVYTWARIGIVVGIFSGAVVLGTLALGQVQKARKTQAEIEQLRRGEALHE